MTLNAYHLKKFKSETFQQSDVVECLVDCTVSRLECTLTKQHGLNGGTYFLKTPGNSISKTLN